MGHLDTRDPIEVDTTIDFTKKRSPAPHTSIAFIPEPDQPYDPPLHSASLPLHEPYPSASG